MPKTRVHVADQVVPTPLEEHLGEVWDPRGHEQQIASATEILRRFCEEVTQGRVPAVTLDQIRQAAGTLGHFSGYPDDAHGMECFLESKIAESSYREVARMLPQFAEQMNSLIQARSARLTELTKPSAPARPQIVNEDDLPF